MKEGVRFGRGKISLFGEGRVGKTALARSIQGKAFQHTESTAGVENSFIDVTMETGRMLEGAWNACEKPGEVVESTLADNIASMSRMKRREEMQMISRSLGSGGDGSH